MKRTADYYIKTGLALIGAVFLIISGTLPILQDKIFFDSDEWTQGLDHIEYTSPLNHPLWYSIVLSAIIVFALGYFYHKKVNKVLTYVFAPVLGLGIWLVTLHYTYSFNILFGSRTIGETGEGYTFAVWGYVFVVLATFMSFAEKKKIPETIENEDLLDN